MGVYTKVIVDFPYMFWDDKEFLHSILSKNENDMEIPFHTFILQSRYNKNATSIVGVTSGDKAIKIENMDQNEVLKIFMKNIKLIFKDKDIPKPTNIYISR
jgi:hypothetical protein